PQPLRTLHGERDPLTAAYAKRSHAPLALAIGERRKQRHEHPATGGADGMTQGDGAPPDIDAIAGKPEHLVVYERDHREGLVDLPQIHVRGLPADAAEELFDRARGRSREPLGGLRMAGVADEAGEGLAT